MHRFQWKSSQLHPETFLPRFWLLEIVRNRFLKTADRGSSGRLFVFVSHVHQIEREGEEKSESDDHEQADEERIVTEEIEPNKTQTEESSNEKCGAAMSATPAGMRYPAREKKLRRVRFM